MNFAGEVREELAHILAEKECCMTAEIIALMRMNGNLLIAGNGKLGLLFETYSSSLARKFISYLKMKIDKDVYVEVKVVKFSKLKKKSKYIVKLVPSNQVKDFLIFCGIVSRDEGYAQNLNFDKDSFFLKKVCCKQSYLRGIFESSGFVNKPGTDYHLEISVHKKILAETILKLLKNFEIEGKIIERGESSVVYLKSAEKIISFLRITSAYQSLLKFENIRIVRDIKNQVNRKVNCETANLQKTVNTALRQITKIKKIDELIGLMNLKPKLYKVAKLRLENPEADLNELLNLLDENITKSGLNHRLHKLEKIYDEIMVEAHAGEQ